MGKTNERALFTVLGELETLQGEREAAVEQIKAEFEAKIAEVADSFSEREAALMTEIENHPRKGEMTATVANAFGFKMKSTRGAKAGDGQVHYMLVHRNTGEPVVGDDGKPVATYEREVTKVKPALRETLGEDLSGYAIKNVDTGAIVEEALSWRKERVQNAA